MFTPRKILHPTDFSTEAADAFRLACSLARDHRAELLVIHVMPPPVCWGEVVARRPPDSYEHQLWREYLEPLCAAEPDIHIEARIESGNPVERIVSIAAEEGCDLIVMGTHGRSGLGRVVLGSVAEQVLRKASCPVLTVRAASEHLPLAEPPIQASEPAQMSEIEMVVADQEVS